MRWDLKRIDLCDRIVTKFLWFPAVCDKNHVHWLEKMAVVQHWNYVINRWCDNPPPHRCPDKKKDA